MKTLMSFMILLGAGAPLNSFAQAPSTDENTGTRQRAEYCEIEVRDDIAEQFLIIDPLTSSKNNFIPISHTDVVKNGNVPALLFAFKHNPDESYTAKIYDRTGRILSMKRIGPVMSPSANDFKNLIDSLDDCATLNRKGK